jgi:hypothetical protein
MTKTTARASLRRWHPHSWTRRDETFETFETTGETNKPPVLVDMDDMLEQRDLVTLHRTAGRAASDNDIADRLFHPEPGLEGTRWYDDLERIVGMSIRCNFESPNETFTLECPRKDTGNGAVHKVRNYRPARSITVLAVLRKGNDTRTLKLDTDFAVIDEYEPGPVRAGVLITADTHLDIDELAELIHDALFEPGGNHDDDSIATQLEDSRENAHHAACKLLLDHDTAEYEAIRYAAQRRLNHLIPDGHTVQIIKHPGIESLEVNVSRDVG